MKEHGVMVEFRMTKEFNEGNEVGHGGSKQKPSPSDHKIEVRSLNCPS